MEAFLVPESSVDYGEHAVDIVEIQKPGIVGSNKGKIIGILAMEEEIKLDELKELNPKTEYQVRLDSTGDEVVCYGSNLHPLCACETVLYTDYQEWSNRSSNDFMFPGEVVRCSQVDVSHLSVGDLVEVQKLVIENEKCQIMEVVL